MQFSIVALSALAMLKPALATFYVYGCEDLSGCNGECDMLLSAEDDQEFGCMSGSCTHAIKTEGIEEAGVRKRVVLFADPACEGAGSEQIGEHKTDGCFITGKDLPVGGFQVWNV
ncbi:hypothetical protein Q7P37_008881 [Cladosporium fusiforme]